MEETKILKPNPISTTQFTWDKASKTFIGEISSTHGFGRVYNDSADEGLTLVSQWTGREMVFVVEHTERDQDGDVQFWLLKPVDRSLWATVKLFND
jgi:hypothetical protein